MPETREILVISGKGGTGKTSLTAAFAHLAGEAVLCDLDVDAPDLHLILAPRPWRREEFYSGHEAVIDPAACTGCGTCAQMCRYGAVVAEGEVFRVEPLACEGCKVCVEFCPEGAIAFPQRHCGRWYLSQSRFGPVVHAQLFAGAENSGRLVTLLRQQARELAQRQGRELILCDGTPGIGCPVISSLSGVELAVVVTEPTPSGRHDLERVVELCRHFRVPAAVVINKCDLSEEHSRGIEDFCTTRGLELVARLPFDPVVVEAMVEGRSVTEHAPHGPLARQVARAWGRICELARVPRAA